MKYRKKPVTIEAIQFQNNADRILEIKKFVGAEPLRVNYEDKKHPYIPIETLEGTMKANVGDYIIKGVNGEFYPCKPDIFEKTYEKCNETDAETMSFGDAIEALKSGKKVARKGWNGKGMFLWLKPAATVKSEWCKDPLLKSLADSNGGEISALGTVCMYTHDSTGRKAILTGWLASQSDMLLEDWEIVG